MKTLLTFIFSLTLKADSSWDYLQIPKNDIEHGIELLKASGYYQKDNTQLLINDFIEIFLKRRLITN